MPGVRQGCRDRAEEGGEHDEPKEQQRHRENPLPEVDWVEVYRRWGELRYGPVEGTDVSVYQRGPFEPVYPPILDDVLFFLDAANRIPNAGSEVVDQRQDKHELEYPDVGNQVVRENEVTQFLYDHDELRDAERAQKPQHAAEAQGLAQARNVQDAGQVETAVKKYPVCEYNEDIGKEPRAQVVASNLPHPHFHDAPVVIARDEGHEDVERPEDVCHEAHAASKLVVLIVKRHQGHREHVIRDDQQAEEVPSQTQGRSWPQHEHLHGMGAPEHVARPHLAQRPAGPRDRRGRDRRGHARDLHVLGPDRPEHRPVAIHLRGEVPAELARGPTGGPS
mmetsp:Transcript_70469/g.199862  ORF Transcript_70469/g.199862 Transcript_70469/m.199862 type:complete len:335 (+) Transcript_70469:987-1991(+)